VQDQVNILIQVHAADIIFQ